MNQPAVSLRMSMAAGAALGQALGFAVFALIFPWERGVLHFSGFLESEAGPSFATDAWLLWAACVGVGGLLGWGAGRLAGGKEWLPRVGVASSGLYVLFLRGMRTPAALPLSGLEPPGAITWWLPVLLALSACGLFFFLFSRRRGEVHFHFAPCLPVWHLLLSLVALHLAAQVSYLFSRFSGFWDGLTGIIGLI